MALDSSTQWPRWLAPAVVVGMCSAAYGVGLFNGEQRYAVALVALEQRLEGHQAMDIHDGAVRVDTYRLEIRTLEAKIDRLEMTMIRIEELLRGR